MAEVDEDGLVKILDLPGNVAVMVRYQGMVSVFHRHRPARRAGGQLPPAKNFIDELVFANLKQVGVPPRRSATTPRSSAASSLDIAGRLADGGGGAGVPGRAPSPTSATA